ncbi:MAG: hypothetical protein ABIY55_35080, partial [Kofleriaceae bacterium]
MGPRATIPILVASVAEMATPAHRQKLVYGIWSGYALTIGFAVLAVATSAFELTVWRWAYVVLIAGKLITNTVAWLGLRRERAIMLTQSLNTVTDVV